MFAKKTTFIDELADAVACAEGTHRRWKATGLPMVNLKQLVRRLESVVCGAQDFQVMMDDGRW